MQYKRYQQLNKTATNVNEKDEDPDPFLLENVPTYLGNEDFLENQENDPLCDVSLKD